MGIEEFKPKDDNLNDSDQKLEISRAQTEQQLDKQVDDILSSKQNSIHLIKDEIKLADKIGIPVLMLNIIIAVLLLCVICLGFLAYGFYATVQITTYKEVPVTKNITTEIKGLEKITYGKYIINGDRFSDKEITVKGFLSKSSRTKSDTTVIRNVIVDDLGNTITIEDADSYKIFFPDEGLSTGLYSVKGIFRTDYFGPAIKVTELIPAIRQEEVIDTKSELITTYEMISNKTSVPKYPFMHECACSKYDTSNPKENFRFRVCSCKNIEFIFDIADYDY